MRQIVIDLVEGLYSNIPICCIISYCRGRTGIEASQEYRAKYGSVTGYYNSGPNYIACRACESKSSYRTIRLNGSIISKVRRIINSLIKR